MAERLSVSRQTISKWELDAAYPEMDKVIELCRLFSCSMDELVRGDMNYNDDAYSDIRIEEVKPFRYVRYAVISQEPEEDALAHVGRWAEQLGIKDPDIIGWDFPVLSQEQINVFNMHGYAAALIIPDGIVTEGFEVISQEKQRCIAITIKDPMSAPFRLIPNAYKTLMTHMSVNGIADKRDNKIIGCFEREYDKDGIHYMDVYIAIE